ncbi:MAG: GNAT family N-acetyltransferase [Actinomycetota bacterium]|nr:GNAT family N-acetyltransferase [Actinomycetota bacterium]
MTTIDVRPMTADDIDGVLAVVDAADAQAARDAGREPEASTPEGQEQFRRGMERFVERDPDGAWVAVEDGTVVGMAESIRRDAFWGLSMLFVDPPHQSRGLGRRLLDRTLAYAEGSRVRMIMTSPDPRALRRYSRAGLAIHPAVEAEGVVDRAAIPADLPGRSGDVTDLDLVERVDRTLGRSRAEDVEHMLKGGVALDVVDTGAGRGYALHRRNRVRLLGATDERTAALLLWRCLAATDGKAQVWCMTAAQDWAVRVALDARLKVVGAGPLFVAGLDRPPGPWLPSGWYF